MNVRRPIFAGLCCTLALAGSPLRPERPAAGQPVGSRSANSRPVSSRVVLQDGQNYFQGSFGAYASAWGTFFDKSLVRGKDYADTITLRPDRFPAGTVIDTWWPLTMPNKGVWGYHSIFYGNYDGGHPPEAVKPRRVRDIRQLDQDFSFRYTGSAKFNLLTEFYLTGRAGDNAAKIIEIGFFLHTPEETMKFIRNGDYIATYRDATRREWRITRSGTYVTIVPTDGADIPDGRIDMLQVLNLLIKTGTITGAEWFNGIAFGLEPTVGAGKTRLLIRDWRVHYKGVESVASRR
jgi:hypothetical protein